MSDPAEKASAITTSLEVLIYQLADVTDAHAFGVAERDLRQRAAHQRALALTDGHDRKGLARRRALARLYDTVADILVLEMQP